MEDKKIIDLFFARDEKAISETSRTYGKKLNNLATNILGNKEDAMECVNDTLLRAWNSIPPNRPEYLFAYLAMINRRVAFDMIEKNNAKKRSATIVELTSELEECISDNGLIINGEDEDERLTTLINAFLEGLDAKKRIIFIRRYWYADSIKAISERMHMTENAIKTALHRIRKELKKYLLKEGYKV